ncbi:hypothetical protein Pelo_6409 [Pelomyxa schiedti]|nr:hypothetical protein Pelo_6409 [Pelomyxa schiedti]
MRRGRGLGLIAIVGAATVMAIMGWGGVVSADTLWHKVDDTGAYVPIYGITLISHIMDPEKWQPIYDFIENNPHIRSYYTPLPISSYHMTIFPMQTQYDSPAGGNPKKMADHLMTLKPGLEKIQDSLGEWRIKLLPTYKDVSIGNMIIAVSLEPRDFENSLIQKLRKQVAREAGLDYYPEYRFHITLAYRYKNLPKGATDEFKKALEQLRHIFTQTVLGPDRQIALHKPALVLFDDMTAFYPTNPYLWSSHPIALKDLAPPQQQQDTTNTQPRDKHKRQQPDTTTQHQQQEL